MYAHQSRTPVIDQDYTLAAASKIEQAPDFAFATVDGGEIRLSDLWSRSERGLVLVFLRHFGCLFCRDHARQLRDHYPEFIRRGFEVVAIGQGTALRSAKFRADYQLPFLVLGDRSLDSYRLYGLGREAGGGFLNRSSYKAGIGSILRGNLPGKPDGDIGQNPGTFLLTNHGIFLRSHVARHSGNFPSATEIIRWIDEL